MLAETRVGPVVTQDGAVNPARSARTGEMLIQDTHGKYYEGSVRKAVFSGHTQTLTTWSAGTNTTCTGFILSNPAGSPVNLVPLQLSIVQTVSAATIIPYILFGGYAAAGIVTHTTALPVVSTFIGNVKGYGNADSAATLVGSPQWLMPIQNGFYLGTSPATPGLVDLMGSFVIPPGGYIGIGATAAVTGHAGMTWEEVLI
jgi:hypothetical protein